MPKKPWRPMGCAPRNGREFLVVSATGKMRVCNWPEGCVIGNWEKYRTGWEGSAFTYFLPVGWRELPKGPKKKQRTKDVSQ